MYEEVKAFVAACDAAARAYDETRRSGMAGGHDEKVCPICVRDAAWTAAWTALGDSSDPLVRWIAENCTAYQSEARYILEALPASMATLDEIAKNKGWCGKWMYLRRQADAAGVLPQDAEVSA